VPVNEKELALQQVESGIGGPERVTTLKE